MQYIFVFLELVKQVFESLSLSVVVHTNKLVRRVTYCNLLNIFFFFNFFFVYENNKKLYFMHSACRETPFKRLFNPETMH